jgi:hypothetical protein
MRKAALFSSSGNMYGSRTCIEILELEQLPTYVCKGPTKLFSKQNNEIVNNVLIPTVPKHKVIYFKVTIFQGPTKHLFTSQNRVEVS